MMAARLYDASRLQLVDEGDHGIVPFFLGLFLKSIPPAVADIRSAYLSGDMPRVSALAHRIKPSILELDIRLLVEPIKVIETAAVSPSPELAANIELLCSVMEVVAGQMREELNGG